MLVFCASRKQTQSCAELLAELLPHHPGCEAASEAAQEARQALVTQMQESMGGFSNSALEKLMLAGVLHVTCLDFGFCLVGDTCLALGVALWVTCGLACG